MPTHAVLDIDGKIAVDEAIPGIQGSPGDKGPTGDKGLTGDTGLTGDKGPDGDKGATGDPGFTFPVGYVFISVVSTNPATLLGYGTWDTIGAGRVLVGLDAGDPDFDTAEKTGGAKTVQSSVQSFSGNTLASHQHAGVSAGTPAGTNVAEATHTHTYTQVPNHVHVQNIPSSFTGSQSYLSQDTSTTGSTASVLSTANPTNGVASGTTSSGNSHNHDFNGTALGTHQHDGISAGTPTGTNTPGTATSVVQPYLVVYMWKRTA